MNTNFINLKNIQTIEMSAYEAPTPKKENYLTLLFIHGLESSKETWFSVIPKLQDSYKIFAIDLRGHGESPMGENPEGLSIWHFVADIDQFVKEHKLQDFVLISHSMGARIATAYAGLYPENIRNLVIEDMEVLPRIPLKYSSREIEFLKQFNPIQDSLEDVQLELKEYGYSKEKYASWLKQGRIKWLKDKGIYFIGVNPYMMYLTYNACLTSKVAEDSFKNFNDQKLPVLLMKAEHESSVTKEGLDQMQNLLPTMQVKNIAGSSHSIHKTQTDLFIETLNSYLNYPD